MPTITWHGHSCFTLEHGGKRIIIDPFLTGNPKADLEPAKVPKLDAILLSHGHGDHLGDAIPLAKRDRATVIATHELARYCAEHGAPDVHGMHIGGSHDFPFGSVKLVPAIHGGMVEGDGGAAYTTVACGLVITMGGMRVYHCGDTALTMDMQLLQGRVDVMLCPIGDNYTMGVEDAVRAVGFVQPRTVIPMHYGTFPVIAADPQAFVRGVGAAAQVVVLEPGKSWTA